MANKRYNKYKESYESYRENNVEKIREIQRKWYLKNKLKAKEDLEMQRFGRLRQEILERDNFKCVKCGMTQEEHTVLFGRGLTIDHIDGEGRNSKEPNNNLDNLQTLCLRCHSSKDRKRILDLK